MMDDECGKKSTYEIIVAVMGDKANAGSPALLKQSMLRVYNSPAAVYDFLSPARHPPIKLMSRVSSSGL
jgi:hypothetical protein